MYVGCVVEPKAMYVGCVVDHWQQFHVANKAFTAAILSLTIFFLLYII